MHNSLSIFETKVYIFYYKHQFICDKVIPFHGMLFLSTKNGLALGYASTFGRLLGGIGGPGGVTGPGVTSGTGFLPGSSSQLPGGTGTGTGGQKSCQNYQKRMNIQ